MIQHRKHVPGTALLVTAAMAALSAPALAESSPVPAVTYQPGEQFNGDRTPLHNYKKFHLPPPGHGKEWVRDPGGDFLLIAVSTGLILSAINSSDIAPASESKTQQLETKAKAAMGLLSGVASALLAASKQDAPPPPPPPPPALPAPEPRHPDHPHHPHHPLLAHAHEHSPDRGDAKHAAAPGHDQHAAAGRHEHKSRNQGEHHGQDKHADKKKHKNPKQS